MTELIQNIEKYIAQSQLSVKLQQKLGKFKRKKYKQIEIEELEKEWLKESDYADY